jgi:hypothetical protein
MITTGASSNITMVRLQERLHAHFHWNARVWIVIIDHEILVFEILYIMDLSFPVEVEFRKVSRYSVQLGSESFDVIFVDVGVPQLNDKLMSLGTSDLRYHVSEYRVGRDVERDPQPQVSRALIHQAR